MERQQRRFGALDLRWLAAAMTFGALAVSACSDDEQRAPLPAPPSAGVAGAAGTAAIDRGGAGGESAGGLAGMAGKNSTESCASCSASACQSELEACSSNELCAPWLSCVTACEAEGCIDACDQAHADVTRIYSSVYACWCSDCEAECGIARSCEKPCTENNALPPTETAPSTLAETGLFSAEGVYQFVPKYPLWSDGADKDRYIYIPKCSTIDTSDMDHWQFPVGTRLWKTFTVTTDAGATESARVETRLIHRHGPGQGDWLFAAYQWDASAPDDATAATAVPAGVTNAHGTTHDIPSREECVNCHGKLRERVLGFSAFQLSNASVGLDLTIERASKLGWLTVPAPDGFEVPGTAVQQAALGYLHGNCGGCHNDTAQLPAASPILLRLLVGQTDYAQTDLVTTTVGIPTFNEDAATSDTLRIAPMNPEGSSVLIRMQARGSELQMPPLVTTSTKVADASGGVADVTAWVSSLQ